MRVYLVQHAEAKDKSEDPDRSLTDRGWSDIRETAAFVADHSKEPIGTIYHSGKTRARQTAEAIAEYLNPENGVEESKGLKALDDPANWGDRLEESTADVVLVGHLPHLSKLASYLVCGQPEKTVVDVQNAGFICVGKKEEGDWALAWYVIPELLRGR